jgi:hypothetical protein
MGDRTTVRITVTKNTFKNNEKFFKSTDVGADYIDEDGDHLVTLEGYDINYGDWGTLEKFLKENEIEFDKWWGDGGEYSAGNAYYRFVDGKYTYHEIYENDESTLQELLHLKEEFKKDIKKGLKLLDKKIDKLSPFDIEPLKNENSVRFIKEVS